MHPIAAYRTTAVEDVLAPSVQIVAPGPTATFSSGDTISYFIKVSDNDQLHDVQLSVYETAAGFLRWTEIAHPHTDTMTFKGSFSLEAKEALDFTLRVEASDHHDNLVEQQISFLVNP